MKLRVARLRLEAPGFRGRSSGDEKKTGQRSAARESAGDLSFGHPETLTLLLISPRSCNETVVGTPSNDFELTYLLGCSLSEF